MEEIGTYYTATYQQQETPSDLQNIHKSQERPGNSAEFYLHNIHPIPRNADTCTIPINLPHIKD